MLRIAFSKISALLAAGILLSSCAQNSTLPYYNTPDFTPHFLTAAQADEQIDHHIGGFALQNQDGKTITDKDIAGKIHVANFIFTRCGSICPVMTKHMKMLQAAYGGNDQVVLLSYSVTPWADSVPKLKTYVRQNEITANNWHLLTGGKQEIYQLARRSYFAEEDLGYTRDSSEFLHTEHVLLIDKHKRIRGIYNGTLQLEAEQLVKDVAVLIKEDQDK